VQILLADSGDLLKKYDIWVQRTTPELFELAN